MNQHYNNIICNITINTEFYNAINPPLDSDIGTAWIVVASKKLLDYNRIRQDIQEYTNFIEINIPNLLLLF